MQNPNGRPLRYGNADGLFSNCVRVNDCYVWPMPLHMPTPVLSPDSPISKKFHTNSVARILFIICRFFPAGKKLVRWCPTRHCVNPYHHTEAGIYVARRAKMVNPTDLLPEQESSRPLLGPSDEEIQALRPTNLPLLHHLAETAARAGFDCKGIPDHRHKNPFQRKEWTPPPGAPVAEEGVPVLVVKGFNDAPVGAATSKVSDEEWAEIEAGIATPHSLPEVVDEREDVDHTEPTDDIFAMIARRKEWEQKR